MKKYASLGIQFEDIVYEIFKSFHVKNLEREYRLENRYLADFVFNIGEVFYIVELKYYRTNLIKLDLIERAVTTLRAYDPENKYKKILIISSVINEKARKDLEKRYSDMIFIGSNDLLSSCKNVELIAKLKSVIDFEIPQNIQGENIPKIFSIEDNSVEPLIKVNPFIERLNKINEGEDDAQKYEKLCGEIINFLFEENINKYKEQKKTDDGLNRYDAIARISPKTAFWKFIAEEIGSRYVVFEFKNYRENIGQGQILTTEKYLLNLALRRVAFIFCRAGCSNSAEKMLKGALRESGKVIFVLNDEDIINMLNMKENGLEPSDYLFDKADELFMTLSR